ncbi:MAG: hypothetical protein QF775_02745 [archaeon]|jgi:hypothetical protein|nr:hypothetical protein [Euryarchaeota archaeon]MDP6704379.1 hypothetical protein [archaeon]|tara:strand:+ start:12857 stop:13399 length:543 start_codon:yes stop_codon:yes gene_type:complete
MVDDIQEISVISEGEEDVEKELEALEEILGKIVHPIAVRHRDVASNLKEAIHSLKKELKHPEMAAEAHEGEDENIFIISLAIVSMFRNLITYYTERKKAASEDEKVHIDKILSSLNFSTSIKRGVTTWTGEGPLMSAARNIRQLAEIESKKTGKKTWRLWGHEVRIAGKEAHETLDGAKS